MAKARGAVELTKVRAEGEWRRGSLHCAYGGCGTGSGQWCISVRCGGSEEAGPFAQTPPPPPSQPGRPCPPPKESPCQPPPHPACPFYCLHPPPPTTRSAISVQARRSITGMAPKVREANTAPAVYKTEGLAPILRTILER